MAEWNVLIRARIDALKPRETDYKLPGGGSLSAAVQHRRRQAVVLAVSSGRRPIPDSVWQVPGGVPASRQGQARTHLRTDVAGVLIDIEQPGMIRTRISSQVLA